MDGKSRKSYKLCNCKVGLSPSRVMLIYSGVTVTTLWLMSLGKSRCIDMSLLKFALSWKQLMIELMWCHFPTSITRQCKYRIGLSRKYYSTSSRGVGHFQIHASRILALTSTFLLGKKGPFELLRKSGFQSSTSKLDVWNPPSQVLKLSSFHP